jgi:hypothetical protein
MEALVIRTQDRLYMDGEEPPEPGTVAKLYFPLISGCEKLGLLPPLIWYVNGCYAVRDFIALPFRLFSYQEPYGVPKKTKETAEQTDSVDL